MGDELDMLFYQASDSEAYSSGYRDGIKTAFSIFKTRILLYLENEINAEVCGSILKMETESHRKSQKTYTELLELIKDLEEHVTCM